MKIQSKANTGFGSSYTAQNFVNLHWFDRTPFNFRTNLIPVLKNPDPSDDRQRIQLELVWRHWIIFKGTELFEFHSYSEYYLEEINIPATSEQLKIIIEESYKYLQQAFEKSRKEYAIFEPMEDISPDTIEQTVHQLNSFLLQLQ